MVILRALGRRRTRGQSSRPGPWDTAAHSTRVNVHCAFCPCPNWATGLRGQSVGFLCPSVPETRIAPGPRASSPDPDSGSFLGGTKLLFSLFFSLFRRVFLFFLLFQLTTHWAPQLRAKAERRGNIDFFFLYCSNCISFPSFSNTLSGIGSLHQCIYWNMVKIILVNFQKYSIMLIYSGK